MTAPAHSVLRRLPGLASAVACAVGAVVLFGWLLRSAVLVGLVPGLVPMNPATAVGFVVSGLALARLTREPGGARRPPVVSGLAALVVTGAALRLLGYAGAHEVGIDTVLFHAQLASGPYAPNRMAPNTAASFLLVGAALFLIERPDRPRTRIAHVLASVVGLQSLAVLVGYAYGEIGLARVPSHIPMALNTAASFLTLAFGILATRPGAAIVMLVESRRAGGVAARNLMPIALAAPIMLGWARLAGERAGLYDPSFGVALFVVANIVVISGAIWHTALALEETDRARAQAAAALTAKTRELEAANKELEAFSYSVSHDLRAPLRAVDGFARILVEDHGERLDAEAQRVVGVIRDNARRMGRLIDDLLALSRLGRKELASATVDMTALAEAVADQVKMEQPDHPVTLSVHDLGTATGDPGMLQQVFANLLRNAWKFTRGRPAPAVEIGARPNGAGMVYWVGDNGVGFDMAHAGKLFGVFQRLHAGDYEGTGIGLALVQRIVHRHGGRVWAEGAVERGATFYFTLPGRREG